MFCISILERDPEALVARARALSPQADLIEIRLDGLSDAGIKPDKGTLLATKDAAGDCPILFTNRSKEEGGYFNGLEEERIIWLEQSVTSGASMIDVELNTTPALRDRLLQLCKRQGVKTIVSYHNLIETPTLGHLSKILKEAGDTGTDIIKVVTTAQNQEDILTVLGLYKKAWEVSLSLIAFAMGPLGRITRIAALALGAPFVYCSPDSKAQTAPGQMTISTMRMLSSTLL